MAKLWLASRMRLFEPLHVAPWALRKNIYLQSVEILQNVTVIASEPYSITFASRSKKNYDVTEIANDYAVNFAMACINEQTEQVTMRTCLEHR